MLNCETCFAMRG